MRKDYSRRIGCQFVVKDQFLQMFLRCLNPRMIKMIKNDQGRMIEYDWNAVENVEITLSCCRFLKRSGAQSLSVRRSQRSHSRSHLVTSWHHMDPMDPMDPMATSNVERCFKIRKQPETTKKSMRLWQNTAMHSMHSMHVCGDTSKLGTAAYNFEHHSHWNSLDRTLQSQTLSQTSEMQWSSEIQHFFKRKLALSV